MQAVETRVMNNNSVPTGLNQDPQSRKTTKAEPLRCKALSDYVARQDDELTFRAGDVIFVPAPGTGERWKGVFNGKVGFFPKIFVNNTSEESKAAPTNRMRASSAHTAENDEQLSFPKDAVLFVTEHVDDNWVQAMYLGVSGLAPLSHLSELSPEDASKAFAGLRCQAVRSHVADSPEELSFKIGDIVFVAKANSGDGMWKGVCNSEVGVFPQEYVLDTAVMSKEEIAAVVERNKQSEDEITRMQAIDDMRKKKQAALDGRVLEVAKEQQQEQEQEQEQQPSEAVAKATQKILDNVLGKGQPSTETSSNSAAAAAASTQDELPQAAAKKMSLVPTKATAKEMKEMEKKHAAQLKLEAKKAKEEEKQRLKEEKEAAKKAKEAEKQAAKAAKAAAKAK